MTIEQWALVSACLAKVDEMHGWLSSMRGASHPMDRKGGTPFAAPEHFEVVFGPRPDVRSNPAAEAEWRRHAAKVKWITLNPPSIDLVAPTERFKQDTGKGLAFLYYGTTMQAAILPSPGIDVTRFEAKRLIESYAGLFQDGELILG